MTKRSKNIEKQETERQKSNEGGKEGIKELYNVTSKLKAIKITMLKGRTLLRRVLSWAMKCELDLLKKKHR